MTDNEMVRRVATAIWALQRDTDCNDYSQLTKSTKALADEMAIAAINAMRDPPDAVLDAMNPSGHYASAVIPEAWNDAIDAMLDAPTGTTASVT